MVATDTLHPVQFRQAPESKADKRAAAKADEADAKGADENIRFGYSDQDIADYQYARYGKDKTSTRDAKEVF